ncbi:ABC transporter permease [Brevibacillus invocatus]|uniref:Nickel import system permease protein NikB n=1 Tax=Brevibacillus invocatus TaxID=173959 RepID=A0A3M8BX58_9BACL|nr:nickel ABC transporter permease [Brevibacillus invocatus]RNB68010.1 ABC transporter permease [Brevibacillus invocatus]
MKTYILQRIFSGMIVMLGLSIFSFALLHLIPGDPAQLMLGGKATAEQIANLREQLGLNKPLPSQYFQYIQGLLTGDLGDSYKTGRPVLYELLERFPATAKLAFTGTIIAIALGIPLGIIAARHKGGKLDRLLLAIATVGFSLPTFWCGLLVIMVFAVKLGWFPIAGGTGWRDLILPAFTLGVLQSTIIIRLTRSTMVEVLGNEYIRTARAKGLNESIIMVRHAFRNVMVPVVTVLGLQIASLLGGAIITEQVFNWPGIGTLSIEAISNRDFPIIQGSIMLIGFVYVIVNLIVDLLYMLIDPRIQYSSKEAA